MNDSALTFSLVALILMTVVAGQLAVWWIDADAQVQEMKKTYYRMPVAHERLLIKCESSQKCSGIYYPDPGFAGVMTIKERAEWSVKE